MSNEEVLDDVVANKDLSGFNYPLNFEFKVTSLANDFVVKDASGKSLAYVRQKMFKFKEAISVFSDQSKQTTLYKINADRVIDFNAIYYFTNQDEEVFGKVGRKGAKSLLKAHYEIFDKDNNQEFLIQEENPWAKLGDALLGEIPVLGLFTGYLFNPKYIVTRSNGEKVARLSKEPSFFGRRFKLDKLGEIEAKEGERMLLAIMMMSLLERRRG